MSPIESICVVVVIVVAACSMPLQEAGDLRHLGSPEVSVLVGLPLWWLLGPSPSIWPHVDVAGALAGGRSWP